MYKNNVFFNFNSYIAFMIKLHIEVTNINKLIINI